MNYLGCYTATTDEIVAVQNPPSPVVTGDTIMGLYQDPQTLERTARMLIYDTDTWVATGPILPANTLASSLLPLEIQYTNILDPNGLGTFSTQFGYVQSISLGSEYLTTATVGQSILASDSLLEIHDIYTGQIIENSSISTVGLLPIYIRNGGAVVGVGSAVYNGFAWTVLWYKMALSSGAAPRTVYDTATIIYEKTFKMIGNTTNYTMIVHEANGSHEINGTYDGLYTTYLFSGINDEGTYDYSNTWLSFELRDSTNHTIYYGRRGLSDTTYEAPTTGLMADMGLTEAIAYINEVFAGAHAVTIDHNT